MSIFIRMNNGFPFLITYFGLEYAQGDAEGCNFIRHRDPPLMRGRDFYALLTKGCIIVRF